MDASGLATIKDVKTKGGALSCGGTGADRRRCSRVIKQLLGTQMESSPAIRTTVWSAAE